MSSPLPGTPLRYPAVSTSDSLDATDKFPGAMALLQNLVPDPSTANIWQCRPAAIEATDFAAFTNPQFISDYIVVGNRAYGMVASDRFAGKDEPFSFDLSGSTFTAVAGVTNPNTPISPASSGDWTPPTMAVVGTKVIVTHPGFNGGGGAYFGVIDISDPTAPTWTATNTAPTALAAVPVAVCNFNGRAWFLVNPATGQPGAYYTDVLLPTTITAGTQILTFDDNVALTALAGLPLDNQLGGVVQSLIVFKGVTNLYQVTGDAATSNLAKNALNIATGTEAPNSICATPHGLAFASPDGMRIIDFAAHVSEPIGGAGAGVCLPIVYAKNKSRVCAAANANVLRVTTQNDNKNTSPFEEYWFDLSRKVWSGPHTLPASIIRRWSNTFIVAPVDHLHSLARSDDKQSSTTTFQEYGTDLVWDYKTAMLPDTQAMAEISMTETTLNMALTAAAGMVTVECVDQDDSVIDTVTLTAIGSATVWGAFLWGVGTWLGTASGLRPWQIPWPEPVVARRLALRATAECKSSVKLSDWFMRYEVLNYLQEVA